PFRVAVDVVDLIRAPGAVRAGSTGTALTVRIDETGAMLPIAMHVVFARVARYARVRTVSLQAPYGGRVSIPVDDVAPDHVLSVAFPGWFPIVHRRSPPVRMVVVNLAVLKSHGIHGLRVEAPSAAVVYELAILDRDVADSPRRVGDRDGVL